MRILLTGATGFIGSHVLAALVEAGHAVAALQRGRSPRRTSLPGVTWHALDIAQATDPRDWSHCLDGVDAVINCAGILQDGPGDSTRGVHDRGVATLWTACAQRGIRRVIQISAIGIERHGVTEFSRSKRAGDEALMQRDVDWVVLRPSVVVGRAAAGGSALLRGLAALPLLPQIAGRDALQIVQLEELVQTVLFFLQPGAPAHVALDIAGPETLSVEAAAALYRRWLGWRPARVITLPPWVDGAIGMLADAAGRLGWASPLRTTAQRELRRGATGDAGPWIALTGIRPRRLEHALATMPASEQDRWFARLYFLKPAIIVVFALFWIVTGLVSLGPGWSLGVSVMEGTGVGSLAAPSVIAGAFADMAIGLAMLWRRTARPALWAALALSIVYTIVGSVLAPELWRDPLGPMLKIWPVMMLNLVALVLVEARR